MRSPTSRVQGSMRRLARAFDMTLGRLQPMRPLTIGFALACAALAALAWWLAPRLITVAL